MCLILITNLTLQLSPAYLKVLRTLTITTVGQNCPTPNLFIIKYGLSQVIWNSVLKVRMVLTMSVVAL